jgi:hypothetical protein
MKNLLLFPTLLLTVAAWGAVSPVTGTSSNDNSRTSSNDNSRLSNATVFASSFWDKVRAGRRHAGTTTTPSDGTTTTPADGIGTASGGGTTAPPADGTSTASTTPPAGGTSTTPSDGSTSSPVTGASTAPASGTTTAPASGAASTSGQTWYVNGGGGTRFSVNQPNGQCNGTSPSAYPGVGTNQNCAFKDIRSLWTDGTYAGNPQAGAPAWGWIGSSGDTYLIDCSGGALCRIGQNGPNSGDFYGLAGDPYNAGVPPPINGTPSAHTRILGANYASCTSAAAKAHVNGGYGVGAVFYLQGASYVDLGCFDITDFSSCGLSGQSHACNRNYPLDDYASNGIQTNNTTTNTTITDVNIHGMANAGILGATGDGVVATRVSVSGNASSGWNMDDGSGTTGTGHLTLSYFTTQWNGCAEEYPIVDALPYADCTDDGSSGYGDGLGTATLTSNPGWIMSMDHSVAAYNTQDGFDLLHLQGNGSTLSISDSLAYGNMGQQLKMGAAGTAINNLFVGNCNALRQAIPGIPSGYNSRLTDFCRAADVPVVVAVSDGGLTTKYINNTLYTANSIGVEVTTNGSCTTSCFFQYENNIFLGFQNNVANGYPGGGNGRFPTPIFFDGAQILSVSGSSFTNNLTFNPRDNWTCPQTAWNEQNAVCADPGLVDESFHLYGFGNMSPTSSSIVIGRGISIPGLLSDFTNIVRSTTAPAIGALEQTVNTLVAP